MTAGVATNVASKDGRFFAVIGTDEGLVRERALRLDTELTGGVDDGFTHETVDGNADSTDSAQAICARAAQALQTLPMFGGNKVVWLRNANFLGDTVTGRSEGTQSALERLRATVEQGLPDGVVFLLSALGVDKRFAFWKFVEKTAALEVCDLIDTSREGWTGQVAVVVRQRAEALGLAFDPEALELFVQRAGEASQQIGSELEKLDLFLGPDRRTVEVADVMAVVPLSKAALIFETGQAIQAGKVPRAIQLIDQQLAADESAISILRASVIPTVRNLFMARLILDLFKPPLTSYQAFSGALNRLPEADRAWLPQKKDGSGVNVYPLFLCAPMAELFELEGLRRVLEATLKADQSLVTTGLDHRLVLHRLLAELAAARIPGKEIKPHKQSTFRR
jgi:DNA polymerase-3 subunit delta